MAPASICFWADARSVKKPVDSMAMSIWFVAVGLHLAGIGAVNAVTLEQHGVRLGVGQIVDRDQLQPAIRPLEDRPRHEAADPPETVNRNSGHQSAPVCSQKRSA